MAPSGLSPQDVQAKHLIRRLWMSYLKQDLRVIIGILFFITIVAGTTSLYPLLINWAYDAFTEKDQNAVILAPLAAAFVTLVKSGALYYQAALSNGLITRLEEKLRCDLYDHLVDADIAQTSAQSAATHTARFTTDITYILTAVERFIKNFLRDLLTMIALFCAMLYLDWQLTLATLIIAPLAAWPIVALGKHLRLVARETQEKIGDMSTIVHESLSGLRMAKSYNLEGWLKMRAQGLFMHIQHLRLDALNAKARIQPTLEGLGGLAVAAIIAFVGWRILSGQSTVGEFTGFVSALIFAAQPLNGLGNLNAILQEGFAALQRVFVVLDQPATITEEPNAPSLNVPKGSLVFDTVSFSYDGAIPAVSELSFEIPAAATVALVGRSGAGKSTLFNLIPRLYDVTGGRILIDGQDIKNVSLSSLRDNVAIVSQDVTLFNDTVAANIGLGNHDADFSAITYAARYAAAHDFIEKLPEGYDTYVGEKGTRLSGGERQRLSLARALLKNAPILLLDEATSALDAHSEQLVQQALERLSEGRTTLVIAHRLATVLHADLILVLDQGKIAESGTHSDLIKQGGLYASLYKLQFRDA